METAGRDLNLSKSVYFYYENGTSDYNTECKCKCNCKKRKREDDPKSMPNDANGVLVKQPMVIDLDSDEEDEGIQQPSSVLLENIEHQKQDKELQLVAKNNEKGLYLAVADDLAQDGILGKDANGAIDISDIWKQMFLSLEISKGSPVDESSNDDRKEDERLCDHSFILKDDIGYVCRVCGIINKPIHTILEIQYKGSPGFNFLHSNLMDTENPGGCILAHAPGSGKKFMVISFVQSFLSKYPDARHLVVMPKGILSTWKKEFQRWQIEDVPLLDLYSAKAESRKQQLEILMSWKEKKSILFFGYKQLPGPSAALPQHSHYG